MIDCRNPRDYRSYLTFPDRRTDAGLSKSGDNHIRPGVIRERFGLLPPQLRREIFVFSVCLSPEKQMPTTVSSVQNNHCAIFSPNGSGNPI